MKQTPQTTPTQSRTVQMGFKNSPKIPTIRSQVLGPIKRSFKASNQPKHYKTLKQSVTSSRIKPLPHGVCQNSNFLVSTRSKFAFSPDENLWSDFRRSEKEARERKKIKKILSSSSLSLSQPTPLCPFLLIFYLLLLLLLLLLYYYYYYYYHTWFILFHLGPFLPRYNLFLFSSLYFK